MDASGCQLEVRSSPLHGEDDAVVARVVDEAVDLRETDTIAVNATTSSRRSVCRATRSFIERDDVAEVSWPTRW